jgi:hypothetical protein
MTRAPAFVRSCVWLAFGLVVEARIAGARPARDAGDDRAGSTGGAATSGAPTGGAPTADAPSGLNPPAAEGNDGAPSETPPAATSGADASIVPASNAADDAGPGLFEQSQSPTSAATDGGITPAASQSIGGSRFNLGGYTRGDLFVGKVPDFRQANMKAAYGEVSLSVKTPKETHGDGFAEARLRYGLQGEQQQTFVDLREAYANAYLGPLDLRLGKQIVVWGRADALNPTNNLTPFDLRVRSPIEDDRRVGNVGARAFLHFGSSVPLRLEAVWMPIYVPSELPSVVLPRFVAYGPPGFPRPELPNGLEAARLHLELSAFEMSVSYLYGYAPLPGLTLASLTIDPLNPSVLVSRTAYNQHVVGFDFSTAIGSLLAIRAEAAYRRPIDYQMRPYAAHPDLQYVLGVDHSFGAVSVIAQYVGRFVFDWRKENGPDQPLDPSILMNTSSPLLQQAATDAINLELRKTNQILFSQTARVQHLATVRAEWLTAHDTLSVSLLELYNVTTRERLDALKVGYHVSDALVAYVGAEIFTGPDGTLFGLIDQAMSAGYTELRYTF